MNPAEKRQQLWSKTRDIANRRAVEVKNKRKMSSAGVLPQHLETFD